MWSLATQLYKHNWPEVGLATNLLTGLQSYSLNLPKFALCWAAGGVGSRVPNTPDASIADHQRLKYAKKCCMLPLYPSIIILFLAQICPNALKQALLTPSQDIKEMPTVSSLGFFTKVGPFANLEGFNFHQFVEPEKLWPNKNRKKKRYVKISSIFIFEFHKFRVRS